MISSVGGTREATITLASCFRQMSSGDRRRDPCPDYRHCYTPRHDLRCRKADCCHRMGDGRYQGRLHLLSGGIGRSSLRRHRWRVGSRRSRADALAQIVVVPKQRKRISFRSEISTICWTSLRVAGKAPRQGWKCSIRGQEPGLSATENPALPVWASAGPRTAPMTRALRRAPRRRNLCSRCSISVSPYHPRPLAGGRASRCHSWPRASAASSRPRFGLIQARRGMRRLLELDDQLLRTSASATVRSSAWCTPPPFLRPRRHNGRIQPQRTSSQP